MRGDVGDALAVDIDLAAVAQRLQVLGTREGALLAFEDGFRMIGHGVIRPLRVLLAR